MAQGALRPKGNVPSRHLFAPPFSSSGGDAARVRRSEPLNPSRETCHPPGKTAHFPGRETLPAVIPHTGTKLGALAPRKGLGCRVAKSNTQTHPGRKTKEKSSSADPPLAAQTQTIFLSVTEGTALDHRGAPCAMQYILNPCIRSRKNLRYNHSGTVLGSYVEFFNLNLQP